MNTEFENLTVEDLMGQDYYVWISHNKTGGIDIYFEDEDGKEVDMEITITRSEFNDLIKSNIDGTIEMIKQILTRNSLKPSDLQFNLMVGGSTYIPYVRSRVEEVLQIPVNCEIDPTTAVAVGAAYYAATKPKEIGKGTGAKPKTEILPAHRDWLPHRPFRVFLWYTTRLLPAGWAGWKPFGNCLPSGN